MQTWYLAVEKGMKQKALEDFQERMTTAPAEMDWTRVLITAYNPQSFLQVNSEPDLLVI